MSAAARLTISVRPRWWVLPYLKGIALLAGVTGRWPDADRVTAFIVRHGFKLDVVR